MVEQTHGYGDNVKCWTLLAKDQPEGRDLYAVSVAAKLKRALKRKKLSLVDEPRLLLPVACESWMVGTIRVSRAFQPDRGDFLFMASVLTEG